MPPYGDKEDADHRLRVFVRRTLIHANATAVQTVKNDQAGLLTRQG
jgi:hypothetical protein